MPEYIVKYKLEKFGNGYITPDAVYDGGYVWSNDGGIDDMVLVGKANYKVSDGTPDGIIERITQEQWDAHKGGQADDSLKAYKAQQYEKTTDGLFQEAYREKELGRTAKWEAYLAKCKEIYDLTEVPEN